jgi:hypothetical protein
MATEWTLNPLLSNYLAKGLANATQIPESRVRTHRQRRGTRQPDIQIVDLNGVRIVVQGKIGNLDAAIEDCKDIIENGLADACFAASYPDRFREIEDIRELTRELENSKLEVAIVRPPEQLTIEGWPDESISRLGGLTPLQLMEVMNGATIYDEIVRVEAAQRIAALVSNALDRVRQLPQSTLREIHSQLAESLGVSLQSRAAREESEEDE